MAALNRIGGRLQGVDAELRRGAVVEHLRESLGAAAAAGVIAGVVAGEVLGRLPGPRLIDADPATLTSLVGTVFAAALTVVGVTFSVLVVALQLASQQYSSRAIRTALRDRPTRLAIAALMAYLAYLVTLLSTLPVADDSPLGVPVAFVGAVLLLGMIAFLVQHLTNGLRADTIVMRIRDDTIAAARRVEERDADERVDAGRPTVPPVPADALEIDARVGGYLQDVNTDELVARLDGLGASVWFTVPLGAFVGAGTVLARCAPADVDVDAVATLVHHHTQLGGTPTTQRDISSGVQQLVDVALRAMSPAINDPRTAEQAIHQLTFVLCTLAGRQLEWLVTGGWSGSVLVIPRLRVWDLLDDAVDQIRPVAAGFPRVLEALAGLLDSVAAQRPQEASHIGPHLDALLLEAERAGGLDRDLARVRAAVTRVSAHHC